MLRVGLTGDLGSGKSTVARMLAERGAAVLSSDEMARSMMQPGEPVYRAIVERFGSSVLEGDGHLDRDALDRDALARLAFAADASNVQDLNAIVHPAVLEAQEHVIASLAQTQPDAIVVVESALIFSVRVPATENGGSQKNALPQTEAWRSRFDCVVVVTAARPLKIARFVERVAGTRDLSAAERESLERDAARRLDLQAKTLVPTDDSILLLANEGREAELALRVDTLWNELKRRAGPSTPVQING